MNSALTADRTIVSRLRIRRATDPLLARLRAATLLSSAALAPVGLSPAAILVVRRLQDPMPGRLGLRGGGMRLPQEWECAVRSQVDGFARRARRPARDGAVDLADAVLFADHAELLACLARDWLRGALQHWWWQTLFRNRDLASAAIRAWLERPECVPAAMAHLAASGEEAAFVVRLGRQGVHNLLHAVLTAHALPELQAALALVLAVESTAVVPADGPTRAHAAPRLEDRRHALPPWRAGASRTTDVFSDPATDAFVGMCRVLHQAPHRARSRAFAVQARQWAELQTGLTPARDVQVSSARNEEIPASMRSRDAPARRDEPALTPTHGEAVSQVRERPSEQAKTPQWTRQADIPSAQSADAEEIEAERIARSLQKSVRQVPDELRIATRFGGVFFLVNLALFLGLYGDFTKPARRGLSLPLWDFVALVGERLAGAALRDDPVWTLLARLANRIDGEEPGCTFSSRRRFALKRWLGRLLPRLRARLSEALGAEADVSTVLLKLPARVWVTPTRVDVAFALAELPVVIRCSGLDRDPGWVPAAGRSLYFHFD